MIHPPDLPTYTGGAHLREFAATVRVTTRARWQRDSPALAEVLNRSIRRLPTLLRGDYAPGMKCPWRQIAGISRFVMMKKRLAFGSIVMFVRLRSICLHILYRVNFNTSFLYKCLNLKSTYKDHHLPTNVSCKDPIRTRTRTPTANPINLLAPASQTYPVIEKTRAPPLFSISARSLVNKLISRPRCSLPLNSRRANICERATRIDTLAPRGTHIRNLSPAFSFLPSRGMD